MLCEYVLSAQREDFYNITPQVREAVTKSGIMSGIVVVYCSHTTASITINENADPDVVHDLLVGLNKAFPDRAEFRHGEGNSSAHLKASVMGSSATIIIENGKLVLGTWQGIYFCEFDSPRNRKFYVKVVGTWTINSDVSGIPLYMRNITTTNGDGLCMTIISFLKC